jgi:hypothetical protein
LGAGTLAQIMAVTDGLFDDTNASSRIAHRSRYTDQPIRLPTTTSI